MSSPHHLLIRGIMPLLLPFFLGFLVLPLPAQEDPRALDPGDIFFQAWLEIQRAEKLEKQGEHAEAWQKYRQAAKYYDVLNRFHKNWKPHLVQGRVQSTRNAIKTIEPKAAAELAGKQAKTRDLVEGARTSPSPTSPPHATGHQITPSTNTNNELRRQLRQLEIDNQRLTDALARERKTPRRNTNEEQRLSSLIAKKDREINTMRDLLARAPLQKDMDRLTRENQTRERELDITARALKETRRQLNDARKKAEKYQAETELAQRRATEIQESMKQERGVNNRVIRGLRKELKTVTSLLEKTRRELGIANTRVTRMQLRLQESETTIKELTTERDALRIERDALANILKQSDSKGVQKLISENMRLGRKLKEALDRLKFLETRRNATKDDLLQAKSDLAIAKTRIMRYQQQNTQHSRTIKSLESQLRDAQTALTHAQANPGQQANSEEIEILRGTVKRLIAAQDRRRIAEQILWETYQKSKVTIAGMAGAFKDIRKTKIKLSTEEKQILALRRADGEFKTPMRVSLAHARAHGNALESEVSYVHGLVKRHVEKGRIELARGHLLDLNDRVPGNFQTLCNLGVLDIKSNLVSEAVQHFDEAITMQENSPYAHYMLGVAHYRSNNLDTARSSFQRSLHLKPGNPRVHLYLGNIAGAQRRYKQAGEHFKMATHLDPTLSEAYFNLSVLYLQQKNKTDAREAYRQALKNGAHADPDHERQLGI